MLEKYENNQTHTYTLGTQSLTVLSRDADAIRCPDGENLTHRTAS